LKGDKQPIGIHWEEKEFTDHTFGLQKHDTVYVFSDGIVDQYGGPDRKKYKVHNFKKLLLSIQKEPLTKQKQLNANAFDSWRKNFEQIDDVCVIGVRM
jgi:serine phosphatase RsbU (regulator of sigma subunit)